MATIEQRLRNLEVKGCKIAGTAKGRVECDEEGRVARVFFKTHSGGERPATADELTETQTSWDAMKSFMQEHGFESVFDFIHDEGLKAECLKAMEDARRIGGQTQ